MQFATLREERAAAEDRNKLETTQELLRRRLTALRDGGGALPADPVAELFSWLSRGQLSVRDVSFGFPLVFAFLIEMVSAFGPAGIVAYADATRRAEAEHGETKLDTARHVRTEPDASRQGSVLDWVADRGTPTSDARGISCEDLHIDYVRWCQSSNAVPLNLEQFALEFDRVREMPELGGRIRKFGTRYYGIKLADKVAMLSVRK